MLTPGQTAPAFTAETHEGTTVSLADLSGSNVLIWFYPKADTPGCTIEGKGFRDHIAEFDERDTKVFGVSFDTPEENNAFACKFTFPFPLLCDTDRAIGLAYGATDAADAVYPKRISYLIGKDGTILAAYEKVDVASHPEQVLADIDRLATT